MLIFLNTNYHFILVYTIQYNIQCLDTYYERFNLTGKVSDAINSSKRKPNLRVLLFSMVSADIVGAKITFYYGNKTKLSLIAFTAYIILQNIHGSLDL